MVSKLPLSDFRAVRHKLDPEDFAFSEGPDLAPTNLIDEETWSELTHLPDDVAIQTSDHNGHRLKLLQDLWGDWFTAIGTILNGPTSYTAACLTPPTLSNVPAFSSSTASIEPRWQNSASPWNWS